MILPDCTYCGKQVRIDIDIDGAVEVCTGCGVAQSIIDHRPLGTIPTHLVTEIRRAVRTRMRQHRECLAKRCRCPCHELDRRLSA